MSALPQRPNNRGASSDPPPPSLPPRPGQTRKPPSHVAPPPPESESDDEDGPPPLPPHPRGSASLEDDDEPALIYDDCSEQEDNEPGEIYDDFDEGTTREEPPQLPHRPKPPPASPEFYDDITNASGPIVQHIPKKPGRNLPPLPSAVPDKVGVFEDVYEDPDARQPATRRPPSPPPLSAFTTSLSPQSALRQPSPGRRSPSRLADDRSPSRPADDRPLPPVPKVGTSSLPPLPSSLTAASTTSRRGASGPANSAPLFPVPTARGHKSRWSAAGGSEESDDSGGSSSGGPGSRDVKHAPYNPSSMSPVVVPLKNRANKGHLPPLPPPAPHVGDSASQDQGFSPPPAPPIPAALAQRITSTNGVGWRDDGDTEEYPPPPGSQENVYEVNEEGQSSSPLPPPIPPPKDSGPKTSKPAPQPRPSPTSKGIPTAGPQGINLAEMLKKREGLKVVSEPPAEQPTVRHDPKEYSDTSSSFKDVFQKFKEKQSKPGLTPKPAIMPKTMVPAISSNGSSAAPKPASLSMQPKDKTDSPQAPDVMFIHKPNKDIKDKSSNPPLPPVPSPSPVSKPVTKFEPEPSSFSASEDIYDDAASADLLDRYDWYHDDLTRIEGEKRVKAVNKDGAFLVRVSQKDQKYPYTLVVMNGGHVNNLRIRRRQDKKFALGDEKADEMSFIDVVAMINHHKNHNVVLLGSSQAHVKLQHAAAKKIT